MFTLQINSNILGAYTVTAESAQECRDILKALQHIVNTITIYDENGEEFAIYEKTV